MRPTITASPAESAEAQSAAASAAYHALRDPDSHVALFRTTLAGHPAVEQRAVLHLDAPLSEVLASLAALWQLKTSDGLCVCITPASNRLHPALIISEYQWRLFVLVARDVLRDETSPFELWNLVISRAPKLLTCDQIAIVGSEGKLASESSSEQSAEQRGKGQSQTPTTTASQPDASTSGAACDEPRSTPEAQATGQTPVSAPAAAMPSLQAALINCAPPALAPLIGPLLDFGMALTGTPRPHGAAGGSQQSPATQTRGAASSASAQAASAPFAAQATNTSAAPSAPAQGADASSAAARSNTNSNAPLSFDELMARCREQGEAQGRAFGNLAAARAERLGRPRAPSPEPQAPAQQHTAPGSATGSEAFEVVEHEAPAAQASASVDASSTSSAPKPQLSERVVNTNTALSSAWEERLAQMGHSGLSRAQRLEQEREAARRFEERQRAMVEQMEREQAQEAGETPEPAQSSGEKGKGKAEQEETAEPAAQQAASASEATVSDTNASLASGFEAMLQQMRSARAEATYAPYRSKRQQATSSAAAQPVAAEAAATEAPEDSKAAEAASAAAPAPEQTAAPAEVSQQGQQMNQQLSNAFEEMLKAARGG